jgi:Flp pilus assembly protein TadB
VDFLLGQPLGGFLVLVGTVLTAVGVLWIDRLARPTRGPS